MTPQIAPADAQGGNRFVPTNLTVMVGTKVTWTWVGSAAHNVVPDDGSTPSGNLVSSPHESQYTFTQLGTFHYHCQAHGASGGSGMSGTITVIATAP